MTDYPTLGLKKWQIQSIKKWLAMKPYERNGECPLNKEGYTKCLEPAFSICQNLFPKIERWGFCPCKIYKEKHVIKVAKAILKAHEKEYK